MLCICKEIPVSQFLRVEGKPKVRLGDFVRRVKGLIRFKLKELCQKK